jgi:hypothetical protein
MGTLVVVKNKVDGSNIYYGPFTNGEHATGWAARECQGLEWHWEDLNRPGSTFITCSTSDIVDFIQGNPEPEVYVTVNDVNWCVINKEG